MDRRIAEQILPILDKAAEDVDATMDLFKPFATDEQFKRYSDAVGRVIFAIYDLRRPLVVEHPGLDRESR
ncbi:MAG TPA: hypothetical protein VI485_06490 [Vicinamibacterales bacterium]|nr:hypothetical protein [Vicinamibacterales bacterium]